MSDKKPKVVTCRRCGKCQSHRSKRRGGLEFLLSVLSFFPYRCDICNHRFIAFGSKQ